MKSRVIAIAAASLLFLGLVGCGNNGSSQPDQTTTQTTQTTDQTATQPAGQTTTTTSTTQSGSNN